MLISFTVPGLPVAQPRQRHRVVTAGARAFATNYTPKGDPVNTFKAAVQLAARLAHQGALLEGPLSARFTFVFPRPGYLLKPKVSADRLDYARKPDGDNLWKSTADCLNGILYLDDAQLVRVTVQKAYAAKGEQAHTLVEIQGGA